MSTLTSSGPHRPAAAPAPPRSFQIGTPPPASLLGRRLEPGEIALLIVAGLTGVLAALVVPWLVVKILLLVGVPLAGVTAVYLPWRGRTIYRWAEIERSYHRLLRTPEARYASAAPIAGTRVDGTEVAIPAPPGVGRIHWTTASTDHGEVAVLLHTDRRWVSTALEIEGPGVGSRDAEDQEVLISRFGAVLAHVANGEGFVRRLQMLARSLPADPDAHRRDVTTRGNPAAPRWLAASYDELLHAVSTSSEQHRAYLVAALPYTRELAAEARAYGGGNVGVARVVVRELTDIIYRLGEATITVRRPLAIPALASLVHASYDPDHPIDATTGMSARNAWPAELDATHPTYLTARTREQRGQGPWYHATAWVKQWPLTPVGVNFLAPLLVQTPDVIRTVAVTMDLEPTETAIERMLAEKTHDSAEHSRAAKLGRTADPRDLAATHRLDQRGADLAAGAAGVTLVGYVTVSARSPEALARDKRTIAAAAGKSYLHLEWCDREQHRAFATTLPFATGLRRC